MYSHFLLSLFWVSIQTRLNQKKSALVKHVFVSMILNGYRAIDIHLLLPGVRYLTGENLEVVWAKFSSLS